MPRTPQPSDSPLPDGAASRLAKPFLHPTVSRLRSYTPQPSRAPSSASMGTLNPPGLDTPAGSQFSALSRMSSLSNLQQLPSASDTHANGQVPAPDREVFRWTHLRNIGQHIYSSNPQKTAALLGAPAIGTPTVLAANGLICIGTDNGKTSVYDFSQNLKCICGSEDLAQTVGPVTAVALSHDHTYVATGHAFGHVQLFDLKNPRTPSRVVSPTTIEVVSSGRQEGHIRGSRIVNIGFIAGRHTALVSADEHGMAFYHSLGKVLFVDASDILRILGKYPLDDPTIPMPSASAATTPKAQVHSHIPPRPERRRHRFTMLAMSPLPLGTAPHPTDAYNLIALLTPSKLVIVGLKPTPKTWLRAPREPDEGGGKTKWKGTLSWFPSVSTAPAKADTSKKAPNGKDDGSPPTTPILVYTWGNSLRLLKVNEVRGKEIVRNSRSGKSAEIEVGRMVFEDAGRWAAPSDILVAQWLNANQVLVLTDDMLGVYDVRLNALVEQVPFNGMSLVSPSLKRSVNGSMPYSMSIRDIAHSLRAYKGKIFILGREQLQVGTLLTWADRILSFVENGDFLSAIDLARTYYTEEAPGNRNGLPDDPELRKDAIGQKMQELMLASAQYAFSEDRLTDSTHITPDNRGVDRTDLFEGLVRTCARACIAFDEFDFLFEDLFGHYDDAGITRIFLQELEPFVLDGEIKFVPPRITQRLITMHEEDGRPDLVERVIWHIDPACLDINQAIHMCQRYHLYDALIYVYTRALKDYVAPIVELLGLMRKVHQHRRAQLRSPESGGVMDDSMLESTIVNAYKIYPYLSNVLTGLTYPSEEPLPADEADLAKKAIYTFVFFGRSRSWPEGEGSRLVLTAEEEGGVEPTYPYVRQLLRFDAESFLHALDIAFEDSYLTDEPQGMSRLFIVHVLLEVLATGDLPPADVTFLNIFVARNVPKYIQYLELPPKTLHKVLVSLAEDADTNTREDRQLAAEYLLSAYTPHDSERMLRLFEQAGFYRILRSWHRHERRWAPLLVAYIDDPDLRAPDVFTSADEVLTLAARANHGQLPHEIVATIGDALAQLTQASLTYCAGLVDKHVPELHQRALDTLEEDADAEQYAYLRHLLGPPQPDEYEVSSILPQVTPSQRVPQSLRQMFVRLQCRYHPADVISLLKTFPADFVDMAEVALACEASEVYDAVAWAMDKQDKPVDALTKLEAFDKKLTLRLLDLFGTDAPRSREEDFEGVTDALQALVRTGIEICVGRSQALSTVDVPLEDIWYQLLNGQIASVQAVSGYLSDAIDSDTTPADEQQRTLTALRALLQETFTALVSMSSARTVSFPRLFKRLVSSTAQSAKGAQYNEFRTILTGMLESYREDGDMLVITKHLVDRDLYTTTAVLAKEQARGWVAGRGVCARCRRALLGKDGVAADKADMRISVARTGAVYHLDCVT
ncbi:Golgi CORVET complex core vacuolar protein 8-domain-containing protein [Schizophyllum amplum]|uniref:Golgi CORVET complex core vacuolar protein 8-domain-containing protein n=1 Tax=Schizophyllum amplum TaxID=97359 RepID=A0A550CYM8_9AGAR|nr:Golgi CORVET complex core vacuolar protein 8-domain-containing protein [Auriculariopsis ampla]